MVGEVELGVVVCCVGQLVWYLLCVGQCEGGCVWFVVVDGVVVCVIDVQVDGCLGQFVVQQYGWVVFD